MKLMLLITGVFVTHLSLAETHGFAEESAQADRVRSFIKLVREGEIAESKEEVFAKFVPLANEAPADTVRALFDIERHPGQIDPNNITVGMFAGQLAANSSIAGPEFWRALASELADPGLRKSAFEFIERCGKASEVYVADENMPDGYWAAAFEYAPMATVLRLREVDVNENAARYGTDEAYRQDMVDKLDAATLLVQLYVELCGRATHSRASQAVCSDIHDATVAQLKLLAAHEKWWVRMYTVAAMTRCKGLRPTNETLRQMVESEKDARVLMALRELNQP